mmetsp:Transcript_86034/g.229599  ORF Transcript_86034/g.229599 Transcript_86034/m.229599 type:complete len:80 (+) Transcript_86034:291-530(+)
MMNLPPRHVVNELVSLQSAVLHNSSNPYHQLDTKLHSLRISGSRWRIIRWPNVITVRSRLTSPFHEEHPSKSPETPAPE